MNMIQQTMTALFDNRGDATKAITELTAAGIPRASIKLMPEDETASGSTMGTAYDTGRDEKGFFASLSEFFLPDEDRSTYAEAMHRGSIMVTVTVDQTHAERAEDILEEHGTVDLEERENAWRAEGWQGSRVGAAASSAGTTKATSRPKVASRSTDGDEVIPVVEEQLHVGKRDVSKGRVKVRSYVVETPVSEQVNLQTESVHVERRPVDRAMAVGDEAFRERTIEARATSQEAVVSKEARVTGEVVLTKDIGQRTETISDKVRSTKVEIEDDRAAKEKAMLDRTVGETPKRSV
jgi:uncharacterized protein (TIGR02271 family)